MTMPDTRRSPAAPTFAGLTRLAALVIVATGIGGAHARAWQRDPGAGAVPSEVRFLVPPAPLQQPLVPVLPGGVVGPQLDAESGGPPTAQPSDATEDQAVGSPLHLTGPEPADEGSGDRVRQRIALALALIAIIGIAAIMASVRRTSRR